MKHNSRFPSPTAILAIEPFVWKAPRAWLAISPPGSVLRLAVTAPTEAAARDDFANELEAWAALAEQAE
jgi:hypothetical protein